MPVETIEAKFAIKPMAERKFDFFVSHCQTSGQDQCGKLDVLLTMRGAKNWYDMQVQDLTAAGMERGERDMGA
jgi:hypothetical protein